MPTELSFIDMHTAGEPVRIVTGGYPRLAGSTILAKRRDARENHDALRRAMMLEPRGHAGMYGVIPVEPSIPGAVIGVLFTHNEGYSTMCGHATIALGRWIVDQGLVARTEPVTRFAIEAPCGRLNLACTVEAGEVTDVRFESVPAFVMARELGVEVPGRGRIVTDIAYGGAFYAILPAAALGLDFFGSPVDELRDAAGDLVDAIRASVAIRHPEEPDLGFLYGAIVTDGAETTAESWNLCVFAERQIDRSPTGSGVTARMALDHAKGLLRPGQERSFRGISGEPFTGRVSREAPGPQHAVRVEVGGRGFYAGRGSFVIEDADPLGWGFDLARRFADVRG
jgi:proline racemase